MSLKDGENMKPEIEIKKSKRYGAVAFTASAIVLFVSLVIALLLLFIVYQAGNRIGIQATTKVNNIEISGTTYGSGSATFKSDVEIDGTTYGSGSATFKSSMEIDGTTYGSGVITAKSGVRLTTLTTGPIFLSGVGSPVGVVNATIGSLWLRTDSAEMYQNTDGVTAWTKTSTTTGTVTSISQGTGILLSSNPIVSTGSVTLNMAGASCSAGQFVSAISATGTGTCTAGSTGTVTSVAAGTGLSASPSPITTTGTLTVNIAGASCSAGEAVTAISATGTGTCTAVSGASAFSGVSARFAGGVTINSGTETLISFDTELFDTSSYHSNSVNPSRFTVPTTGYYYVTSSANWQADAAGIRYIYIRKNAAGSCTSGGSNIGQSWIGAAVAGPTIHQAVGIINMTAGDYFELCVYHSAPGTKVLTLDPPNAFSVHFLGT